LPVNTTKEQEKKAEAPVEKIKQEAEGKPKSWLAKRVAWLRDLYKKWLDKKNQEHDQQKIGFFSNILRVIMNGIDYLMRKLQNAVD
jgi:hypothetical protein